MQFSLDQVRHYMRQLLAGLSYCHEKVRGQCHWLQTCLFYHFAEAGYPFYAQRKHIGH